MAYLMKSSLQRSVMMMAHRFGGFRRSTSTSTTSASSGQTALHNTTSSEPAVMKNIMNKRHFSGARTLLQDAATFAPPRSAGTSMTPAQAAAILGAFIGVPDLQVGEAISIPAATLEDLLAAIPIDSAIEEAVFTHSAAVTDKFIGKNVYYRGLVEFSNVCTMNCHYCGIRKRQKGVQRYTLTLEEILEVAEYAFNNQFGSIMMQSGELFTPQRVEYLLTAIKAVRAHTIALDKVHGKGLGVSISVGELPYEALKQFYDAGAHRYLIRIETSNPELFKTLHPKEQTFEHRLQTLRDLKKIGYQTGTGVMIGVPGQTLRDLANDLIFFRDEGVSMIGMGPYIPAPGTPTAEAYYEECARLKRDHKARQNELFEMTTRMIALARITMGNVNLAATTALQAINPNGRELAMKRGANVLMPMLTPMNYRKSYQLYAGKPIHDSQTEIQRRLEEQVAAAGKQIAFGQWGDPRRHFEHPVVRSAPDGSLVCGCHHHHHHDGEECGHHHHEAHL